MSRSFNRPMTHQEYLKIRYLSNNADEDDRKLKKKKSKSSKTGSFVKNATVKIVDEDVDFRQLTKHNNSDDEELYFGTKEERPVISEVIDERPTHLRTDDDRKSKWKAIGDVNDQYDADVIKIAENHIKQTNTSKTKTLDGKKAGLSNAKEIKKELEELKQKNEQNIKRMDANLSGKNSKTVFRDRKSGKIRDIDKELEEKKALDEEKAIREMEKKAVYDRWSKGLTQREEQLEKIESDLHEMSKPLARYEDDEDLDKLLRERDREDDPMLKEIQKKRKEEKLKDPNSKIFPEYQGPPPPPNRFGIRPGYRWDGVDRSNGFENKYFSKIAEREATREEAYQWSVQDM